jgi:hypothetical protein
MREVLAPICAVCPVLDECRNFVARTALPVTEHFIAGMTPAQASRFRHGRDNREWRRFHHRPPCGTRAAYTLHLEYGEPTDAACRAANAAAKADHSEQLAHAS